MAIAGILLAIVSLNFNSMNKKYGIESQVKQMQADLDSMRAKAITTKQRYEVVLNPTSYLFRCYSSPADDLGVVLENKTVKYPMQQYLTAGSGSYSALSDYSLSFDPHGCMTCYASPAPFYLVVSPEVNGPAVNAVVVQGTKTNVGIIQEGSCVLK